MTKGKSTLQRMGEIAARVMKQPGYVFSDLEQVFAGLDGAGSTLLLNEILTSILEAPPGAEQPFRDRIHLLAVEDFNLTLKVAGASRPAQEICLTELDMLLLNLGSSEVRVPRLVASVDPAQIHARPRSLTPGEPLVLEPHRWALLPAYGDIVDLDSATPTTPLLVIHSRPRGVMTWVFDRASLSPLRLTASHLQSSRMQIAALVMGEIGAARDAARLEALALSDHAHFVRWEAAESVYKLDRERGARLLRERLVFDPSPAIRDAAQRTLENLADTPS